MTTRSLSWLGLILLLGLAGAVLALQRTGRLELVSQLETARETQRRSDALRAENDRLTAAQPPPSEVERLREDRVALGRLRQEVATLREAAKGLALPAGLFPNTQKVDTAQMLRDRRRIPSEQLTNRGWKTPLDAFETVLWSAANGEVDALAQALVFDPRWSQQVEMLWARVSPTTRAEYGSVERLFAAMTIRDVPLGTAQLIHETQLKAGDHALPGPGHAFMVTTLSGADKSTRSVGLYFRPSEKGWQLLVPGSAVTKYRDQLVGKPTPPQGNPSAPE